MFLMLFDPVVLLDPERRVLKMLLEISSSSLSRRQVLPRLHLMLEKLQMIVLERMLLLILLELSSSRLSPKHLPPRLKLIWEKVARKSLSVSLAFAMQSAGRSSDRHYHVA